MEPIKQFKKALQREKGSPGWTTKDRQIAFERYNNQWAWELDEGEAETEEFIEQFYKLVEEISPQMDGFKTRKEAVQAAQEFCKKTNLQIDFSGLKAFSGTFYKRFYLDYEVCFQHYPWFSGGGWLVSRLPKGSHKLLEEVYLDAKTMHWQADSFEVEFFNNLNSAIAGFLSVATK